MSLRWLGVSFAFTFALAAQPAGATQDVACPEGQAIRAIADKTAVCVPVPPPVDLAPLNAAISAESAARKTADEELPDRLDVTVLNGTYAFTGTALCLSSSRGFNDDLTPKIDLVQGTGSTIVNASSQSVNGVRTFDGNGGGTVEATFHVINYPSLFYFIGIPPSPPVVVGATTNAGVATLWTVNGTFTYDENADGTLTINDDAMTGRIDKGVQQVGWITSTRNVPKSFARLGKDLKAISITNDDVSVETAVLTHPTDATMHFDTPRICHRERHLLKLKSSG